MNQNAEKENTVVFNSIEKGITAGYCPCFRCHPDDISQCGAKGYLKSQADDWLKKHYTEKFSLGAISGDLAVHPNYLVRIYKETSGETLLNRHNRIRCEKACELLKETDLSISYIANQVGYQTSSHFTVVFKRFMGCTPKDYRVQYMFSSNFLPVTV